MSFRNDSTGEVFGDEDEYLRSMKQDDSYEFDFDFEHVANRFGEGNDDVELEVARVSLSFSWDESPTPGYVVSISIDSPTPIPYEWTDEPEQLFRDLWHGDAADYMRTVGVGSELHKDWPF